jgi:flavin-dependent dehydrogenase
MDNNLLRRAQRLGVSVQENSTVTELIEERGVVRGVRLKSGGVEREHLAAITIDATGRARALARKVRCSVRAGSSRSKPQLIALKAHLEKTRAAPGVCEIYSYPGGYGGLSTIENDLSNLCFIVAAADVRRCHSNPEAVLRETVMSNPRAAYTLDAATVCSEWLSVSLEGFGRQQPSPAPGLLAIGDSAAFIDPFTGSGMLMALESGELAAAVIVRHLGKPGETPALVALAAEYVREYRRRFKTRLRMCGLLRRVAFNPRFAELTIAACGASERLRSSVAKATRSKNATESPHWQESAK